jgi:hypothetical protein
MRKAGAKTLTSISNRPRNGARLLGRIILPKTHSLCANLALQEFSRVLERRRVSMQEKFGSEVSARESDAGNNDRD